MLNSNKKRYAKLDPEPGDLKYPTLSASASEGVNTRASFVFNKLKETEKQFLECVTKGDTVTAKQILDSEPLVVNCVDFQIAHKLNDYNQCSYSRVNPCQVVQQWLLDQLRKKLYLGASGLHLALKKNDEKMVDLLLSRKHLDVMDCALHAIKLNQPRHVELILDKIKKIRFSLEFSPCINSIEFPDYLTPMMLAAQCGHTEIIGMLFDRGHPQINPPHRARCVCKECLNNLKGKDPLIHAFTLLELYKAICNPAYLCQVTADPILMVFELVLELREMVQLNRVLHLQYEQLIEDTEKFAADLIGQCRTSDEVRTILNERSGSNLRGNFLFPRLILAVDYKQKQFVAQTNVQEVLESAWLQDWYEWRGFSDKQRAVFFVGRIVMLPVVCVVCICLPRSAMAKFYSIPLNRMLSSVASYLIFLALLFWESDQDKKDQSRYDILYDTGWLVLIYIYVLSHILNSFRMWTLQGTKRFFTFKWNLYDLATQLMFLLTFAFWVSALWTLGWQPDLERKFWHYLDPQLLAEGFFCIGTVMAFARLLLIVQIHHALGPMQVSLGKMTKDFSQFTIIFAIIIGSFTAGMCRLYEYYDGMTQTDPETKAESRQESSFVSVYDTFKVLFWGLFCMSSQDGGSVVIENLPSEEGEVESINNHEFTQAVGYTLFGVYTVLTVIVLLNMLIAAMSNTFQRVTDNVDIEWIFGRTEVYLAFMSQTVLPPPFNFFPAGVGVNACSGFFSKIFRGWCPEQELPGAEEPEQKDFKTVMQNIVQRYFSQKEEQGDSAE